MGSCSLFQRHTSLTARYRHLLFYSPLQMFLFCRIEALSSGAGTEKVPETTNVTAWTYKTNEGSGSFWGTLLKENFYTLPAWVPVVLSPHRGTADGWTCVCANANANVKGSECCFVIQRVCQRDEGVCAELLILLHQVLLCYKASGFSVRSDISGLDPAEGKNTATFLQMLHGFYLSHTYPPAGEGDEL